MSFWAYENWRAHGHRVTVHADHCAHCKGGSGQRGGTDSSNGRWHGPFPTADQASTAVPRVPVSGCGHCRPL